MAPSRRASLALLGALWLTGLPVWGLSMRHSAAEPRLDDARPGERYALGDPPTNLTIVNTGVERVETSLALRETPPDKLLDGFEPVAGAKWLSLTGKSLTLEAGADVRAPVAVTVPKNPGGYGQYQAQFVTRSRSPSGGDLPLESSVLVILRDPEEDKRMKARSGADKRPDVDFALARRERDALVGLGGKTRLKGVLQVVNPGDKPLTLIVTAESPPDRAELWKGYSPGPNPRFLRPMQAVSTAPPNKLTDLELEFEAPDEPRYRGRLWAFDVRVEAPQSTENKTSTFRLYVKTAPTGEPLKR